MTAIVMITTSVDTKERAEAIATVLVEESLAACVHVTAIRSFYRWEGNVVDADEYSVQIKTTAVLAKPVEARILSLHDYELPEISVVALADGHAPYLDWITASVRPS